VDSGDKPDRFRGPGFDREARDVCMTRASREIYIGRRESVAYTNFTKRKVVQ